MLTSLQPYLDLILKERSWSWALVCLLYILAALFVRGWFVRPLAAQVRALDKKFSHSLKSHYLRLSLLGWVFLLLPLLLIVYYWRKDAFPISINDGLLITTGLASFILSVLLHLQAFGMAALLTLKDRQEAESPEV